jgi:hypothetical protein
VVRREQSREWKRQFREQFGWRKYRDEYSTFLDADDERMHRREYMRQYRARKRQKRDMAMSTEVLQMHTTGVVLKESTQNQRALASAGGERYYVGHCGFPDPCAGHVGGL